MVGWKNYCESFVLKAEDSLYVNFQISLRAILYNNREGCLEGEQMTHLITSIFVGGNMPRCLLGSAPLPVSVNLCAVT